MEVKKSLEIDQIYEKVKNYDLVLTIEAPLADALNNRLQGPHVGEFAITPKRLAYNKERNEEIPTDPYKG